MVEEEHERHQLEPEEHSRQAIDFIKQRLGEIEQQLQNKPDFPFSPHGVVLYEADVQVSPEISPRFRHMNFETGAEVDRSTDTPERADIVITGQAGGRNGCGPFDYDYMVNADWATVVAAGDGTEGEVWTTFHGFTFRVYSDWAGMIAQAKTDMAASSDNRSALIWGGTYTENVVIEMDAANAGTLIIDGRGMQNTILDGNLTHSGTNTSNEFVLLREFRINGDLISTGPAPGDRLRATHIHVGGDVDIDGNTSDWHFEDCIIIGDVDAAGNVTAFTFENCSVANITTTGNTIRWQYRGGEILGSVNIQQIDDVLFDTYFRGSGTPGYHVQVTGSGNKQLTIRGHMAALSGASAAKDYILFNQGATPQVDIVIDVVCEKVPSTTNEVHYLRNADGSAMVGGMVKITCGSKATATVGEILEDMAGNYASVKGIFQNFVFILAPCRAVVDLSGSVVDANCIISGSDGSSPLPVTGPLNADFFNGTFVETLDADISEAGGVVTLSLQREGTGDLTMRFSSGLAILDCTPAKTITLTLGDDDAPQANYIYVLESDQTQLTKSTSQWPAAEHIKVGYYLVPSAAFVAAGGGARCYIQQQWNDHRMGADNMGHMAHMAERERLTSARYFSGINPAGTTSYLTIAGASVDYKATSGVIFQMHRHSSPAVDTSDGDEVLVVNWPGVEGAYHNITNLFDIVEDSGGNPIGNNKWFNIVIWGVANKTGTYQPAMINLPAGFYNTQASAEQDISGFDNFDLPREFDLESSTAFLIARITVQKQAGTWAFGSTVNLRRGDLLGARGGASSPETEFPDSTFNIFDATDNTRVVDFQVDQVANGTTRTLTVPDASGIIALTSQSDGTIDHGADLAGLGDSDHDAHLDVDGSKPLTDRWNPGAQIIGNYDFDARPSVLTVADANLGLALGGGLAILKFDANDALIYSRATNVLDFQVGSIDVSALAFPGWSDTGITGAELETLSDTSDADPLHAHTNHGVTHIAAHALLDGSVHSDSVADGVTRGSLIYGNGTPKWDELTLGGAGAVLGSDGTDAAWVVAKRSIVLTAGAGRPATTSPCSAPTQVEAGTNDVDYVVLDFDKDADEFAFWGPFDMPDNWDGGTLTIRYKWKPGAGAGAAETVRWAVQLLALDDDDPIDSAWGSAVNVDDTFIAAGDLHKTSESGNITPGSPGSAAGGDSLFVRIFRDVSGDDLAGDARFISARLEYTVNEVSD